MARVTVEDCVEKIPNRFELVMLAAQRSRDISAGAQLSVDRDNDKNPVVALREIADETIVLDELRNLLVRGLQKHVEVDEPEEDESMETMAAAVLASGGFGDAADIRASDDAEVDVEGEGEVELDTEEAAEGGVNPDRE